jgi:hypothetical protein
MPSRAHGPENAEFELRKAYGFVLEGAVPYFWKHRVIEGVRADEAIKLYRHAYKTYRQDNKLAAERWARAAKHLSRALAAEAKIAYLEVHCTDLPSLAGAHSDSLGSHEMSETTADLLNSVAEYVPAGFEQMPEAMIRYLALAWAHLNTLKQPSYHHELLRSERLRAAYEYARVLEILALAYEAELPERKSA